MSLQGWCIEVLEEPVRSSATPFELHGVHEDACAYVNTLGHPVKRLSWPWLTSGEDKSPATHSRWQWTWMDDNSVFKKCGPQLGLVGR
jgi:hypothetical protein